MVGRAVVRVRCGGQVAQDLWLAVVEGSAWSGLDGQVKVGLKGGL